ncbi:T9SS type A sorting domain-containing protein [Mangrovimonas sp. TPBH4]|uniref:T9SS type A sorting domain-containing protein n=1 Tax=Mangrovimonas sp. TPBH4 TaxID=1645914 RepID=UPI0006B4C0DD|nr:T9SS type A sorting domain-containing protein [Mangrovimonas sp. TPBH4]
MKKNYLLLTLLLASTLGFGQTIHVIDDFVTGETPAYTTSTPEEITNTTQYFGVTNETEVDAVVDIEDHNFFGARQLSSTENLTYSGFDVTGETNFTIAIGVAEDDAEDGLEDWDAEDTVSFQYRLDGGSWMDLFVFSGTGTNTAPHLVGEGTILTDDVEEFMETVEISGNTTLDIRVLFEGLTEVDEDIAIEFIAVVSDIEDLPSIEITSPEEETNYPNETTSVDINYTVTGSADEIFIYINDESYALNTNAGDYTYTVPVSNDSTYEIELVALVDGYNIWGDDATLIIGSGSPVLSSETNQIEDFKVYPNPVKNNKFSISSSSNELKEIKLYNVLGKLVLSATAKNNEFINVDHLTSGVYVLKVVEGNNVSTKKLIIE